MQRRILLILGLLGLFFASNGQPLPQNGDSNWSTLNMPINDEFTSLNSNYWRIITGPQWHQNIYSGSQVQIDPSGTGFLELKTTKQSDGSFLCGGLETGATTSGGYNYPYGYYEARLKLPPGKGIYPAFWLFNGDQLSTLCPGNPEEIDIMENPDMGDPAYPSGCSMDNYWGYNWHYTYEPSCQKYTKSGDNVTLLPAEICINGAQTTSTFHTYAVEWLPGSSTLVNNGKNENGILVFYFDGNPKIETLYKNMVPDDNHMEIFLTNGYRSTHVNGTTPNISTYYIDYVRAWELKKDNYLQNSNVSNQSMFDSFVFGIRNSITFTTGNNIRVLSGQKRVFRAAEFITINEGFTVENGAEFTAIVHPCPPPRKSN